MRSSKLRGYALSCVLASLAAAATARAQDATAPLSIEQAVHFALTRNERPKISDLNVAVAAAAVDRARTAFFPTLLVNGSYVQRPEDVVAAGKNSYTNTAAVTLTQPVLNASAFPLLAQAKQNLEGQRAQTVDDKRLLAFEAARDFFGVLTAEAVLAAAQTRLQTSAANVSDTKQRADAQLVSTNDVTRALIDLGNAQREVELDRGARDAAYLGLAFTLNVPTPRSLLTPQPMLDAGRKSVPSQDSLVRVGLSNRPDLVSKRHLATAAHDFASEPLLRLVPVLGLSGSFSLSSDPTLPGHNFYNTEALTTTLTWPLFDAGVRYADKRSRDAQANIADLTTDTLVRTVDAQVRESAYALVAAQNALDASARALDAAKRSADETTVLYKQGLAKAIELVDANDSRFLAEVNYATAEYSVALAYLALRQALGLDPLGTELQ